MAFQQIVFYIFSAMLVGSAAMVVTMRNPVKSALFLVLAFFSASALWLLLQAEFLAIALVLVYVGAVMVLFLFVIMMLDIDLVPLREGFGEYLPIGALVAVLLALMMAMILGPERFGAEIYPAPPALSATHSNTRELGLLLYTMYVYPFEIAAVILLVAIVAAIALTLRKRKDSKYIDPADQIKVKRDERIRLVKIPAQKKN